MLIAFYISAILLFLNMWKETGKFLHEKLLTSLWTFWYSFTIDGRSIFVFRFHLNVEDRYFWIHTFENIVRVRHMFPYNKEINMMHKINKVIIDVFDVMHYIIIWLQRSTLDLHTIWKGNASAKICSLPRQNKEC